MILFCNHLIVVIATNIGGEDNKK